MATGCVGGGEEGREGGEEDRQRLKTRRRGRRQEETKVSEFETDNQESGESGSRARMATTLHS